MAVGAPAYAQNISVAVQEDGQPLTLFTCANGQPCDLSGSPTSVLFGPSTIGDFSIVFTAGSQEFSPDRLSVGQVQITNNSSSTQTLDLAISAVGYPDSVPGFQTTASATMDAGTATLSASYFANNLNQLGAQVSGTDAGLGASFLDTINSGTLSGTQSFANTVGVGFSATAPYSLAEVVQITLSPGGEITTQGVSMAAVPEPRTWLLAGLGFAILGLMGIRRNRTHKTVFAG